MNDQELRRLAEHDAVMNRMKRLHRRRALLKPAPGWWLRSVSTYRRVESRWG